MRKLLFLVVLCALMAGAPAYGQERAPAPPPPPARYESFIYAQDPEGLDLAGTPMPMAAGVELLGFEGMGGGRVVKGSPFSAVAVSETTQSLADGNRIHRSTNVALFRDSEGRFRREVTLPAIGPLAASGKAPQFISIFDPVSGVRFMLRPDDKTAHKFAIKAGEERFRTGRFEKRVPGPGADANLKTEQLGTQTIGGVSAEGTRYTRTIPAGQIGNENPIVVVSERWYSADLQMVVMSKRSDPRFGTTAYQLTNIQRQEPAATLFQVPPDYAIKEGRGGFGMRMHRRREGPPPPAPPAPGEEL